MTWIQTYTGRKFDLLDPRSEDVCLEDIAHALSMQCRFNGHCREFYSVAQHSVHVAGLLPPDLKARGLLHDAAEAYIGDMVRPLKRMDKLYEFSHIERNIMFAIGFRFFGCNYPTDAAKAEIKRADNTMLATEARDLMATPPDDWGLTAEPVEWRITPWSARLAEAEFLDAAAWMLP